MTLETEAEKVVARADESLREGDLAPFSPQAFRRVREHVSAYIRSLVAESAKIARRRRSDVISESHVDDADAFLQAGSGRKWTRYVGTLGGVVLGAAISNFLTMVTSNQFSAGGVVTSAILGIGGAFAVAIQIAQD